ncbi:MAG TPA: hypothetical protein VFV49_00490 [Thermoanaerobaculia bacterium]|nr:hypothetical protein [Thermoanaerobaculia bacterium]
MRHRSLLLSFLFVVAWTLRADAPIAPPRFGSSPEYPFAWQLATNGEEYLLAWSTQTRTQLATLNERGEVIADAGLEIEGRVADAIAVQRDYLVVLGTSLLSVDADTLAVTRTHEIPFSSSVLATDGVTALLANGGGYARVVDADGDPVGPDFSFNQIGTAAVGAAGADGSYLLAWLESRQDDLRLVRAVVRENGESMSAVETLATLDPNRGAAFGRRSVASNGRNFLVSWRSDAKVYVALVSPYGELLRPPATIAEWDYTDAPQVAWNGREFVVVLEARDVTGGADIIALRVDALGKPIGNATSVAAGPALQYHAAVATTGRSTLAVWGEFASCYAAGNGGLQARTIEPLGPIANVSRGAGAREVPAAADAGGTTLVAWVERGALRGVRAALLPSGTEVDLGATTYSQDSPAVGTNGDDWLVVWTDLHEDCTTSLSAVVVDRNGQAGPVRTLAQNAYTKTRPAIAWNGSEYVVVWERTGAIQLVGLRVAADGSPIDTDPIALSASYVDVIYYTHHTGFPSIVWTGQEYLAVWTFSRISYIPLYPDPPPILEVRARRFDRSLFPLGTENVLATKAYGSSLGWNGSEALALWHGSGGTHAARMAADGSVLATHVLGPNTDPTPPSLSIAWTGHDWVAADGAQLLHIGADGSFRSRTDLGASVRASTVTPALLAYQRDDGAATQVFTRKLVRPRRRAASR